MGFGRAVTMGLLLATSGLAMPALAKDKAPKETPLKPSPAFAPPAAEVQKLAAAKDYAGARAKLDAAAAAASTPDDKYYLGNFQIEIGGALKDDALRRQGVENVLASGKLPSTDVARFHVYAGQFALDARDVQAAIPHLEAAIAGNPADSGAPLLLAESYFQQATDTATGNQLSAEGKALALKGLPYLRQAIDIEGRSGKPVPGSWYSRGVQMAAVSGSPDLSTWTMGAVKASPSEESWRNALRVFQDSHKTMTRDENLDVLRLMGATNTLTEYGYQEYIDAASKGGLLGEVKSVTDAGRASGKIPATRYADVYKLNESQLPSDKASLPRAEADAAKAPTGKIAASTGNAYLGYGDYAKAVSLYQLALQKGGVNADEVNTRLGIALARSGDTAGAQAAFNAVAGGNRKEIAQLWLLWLSLKSPA